MNNKYELVNGVKPNYRNGGFMAHIKVKNKHYYADLAKVPFVGIEFMVFEANKAGEVIDWCEVYCSRTSKDVSKDAFVAELEKWIQEIEQ